MGIPSPIAGRSAGEPDDELGQACDLHKGLEPRFQLGSYDQRPDMRGDPRLNGQHSLTSPERVYG